MQDKIWTCHQNTRERTGSAIARATTPNARASPMQQTRFIQSPGRSRAQHNFIVSRHLLVTLHRHFFSHFDISPRPARALSLLICQCFSLNLPTFQPPNDDTLRRASALAERRPLAWPDWSQRGFDATARSAIGLADTILRISRTQQ